jgi:NAD(P)-dependent dehydrogenase (short-subunit alcohol dehydrogenase family)
MTAELEDRVAHVSGRGIGREMAVGLAAAGALLARTAAVIPLMPGPGWGGIVNVSSGIVNVSSGTVGKPRMMVVGTAYPASNAAFEAHTLNLAVERDGAGITVSTFRPGAVDTAVQERIRARPPDKVGDALHDRFVVRRASGSLITPHRSAAGLLNRLTTDALGQIRLVSD